MEQTYRQKLRDIFTAGVAAADPALAVRRALGEQCLPEFSGRLVLIAMGKAAPAMASEAIKLCDPASVIVVSPYQTEPPVPGAKTFVGGHPIPDAGSVTAARAIEDALGMLRAGDHVLALISGGASALVCAPVDGISLQDKVTVNRVLLGSGLDISGMNLVRQNLSRLKGGGLLAKAGAAGVTALILSDVIGNDLRIVASGPTASRVAGRRAAQELLVAARVWDQMPQAVQNHLSQPDEAAVADRAADNRLIGSNEHSVAAIAQVAPGARVHSEPLVGDVADAAQTVIAKAPGLHLFGGETTVRLTGSGKGGRNQELALRVAMLAKAQGWKPGWVFLSGGTDGRDGPTDAAGGLVDGGTLERMRAQGVEPEIALANNDSYTALKAAEDLLITGATGTNVADLQILFRP